MSASQSGGTVTHSAPQKEIQETTSFLPGFCDNRSVLFLVLIIELLAIMLTLANTHRVETFWAELALTSLFMQWIALLVAAIICRFQRWIARLSTPAATIIVLGIAQWCTWLCLLAAQHLTVPLALARPQAISGIITLLALRYFYVQHQWQQNVRAEARARLQALQARIHPHFLFNTLNTIAGLIHRQPDDAEQAVLDLADVLRSALSSRDTITLGEELTLIRRYLAIERLRWGDRLHVVWEIGADVPLDQPIPALLIQPLVENAIHHGLRALPRMENSNDPRKNFNAHIENFSDPIENLRICMERQGDLLCVTVRNPRAATPSLHVGQQIAQQNIRQRLQLAYDLPNPLTVTETADDYRVCFTIPLTPAHHATQSP